MSAPERADMPEETLPVGPRSEPAATDDANALRRDENARTRDTAAHTRDRAADARDGDAETLARALPSAEDLGDDATRAMLAAAGAGRGHAAADRAYAARDRHDAGEDRQYAAGDRWRARSDLRDAQLDSLTGVYGRDLGRVTLLREIDRARRSGAPFVLGFIDVDGLKELNDRDGHAAGDALLQAVTAALKSMLRSYDPIVRVGGDEFICGFTNTEIGPARRRAAEIRAAIADGRATGSIAIGVAELGEGDTLDELTARADADMYIHKQARHRALPRRPSQRPPGQSLADDEPTSS